MNHLSKMNKSQLPEIHKKSFKFIENLIIKSNIMIKLKLKKNLQVLSL